MAREPLESEEGRKRSGSFEDEDGHERKPKGYRSSLCDFDLTPHLSFPEST